LEYRAPNDRNCFDPAFVEADLYNAIVQAHVDDNDYKVMEGLEPEEDDED